MTGMDIDASAEAVLLMAFDGPSASHEAATGEDVATRHGATEVFRTDDRAEGDALMNARRAALPALERLGSILLDDIGVPVDRLPAMVADIAAVARRHDVTIGTFGHAADGNLHPTIIYSADDADERERAQSAFVAIVDAALAHGGTVSGEHGIGSLKMPFVGQMYGQAELDLMHRIKNAFDPQAILNPGRGY
jgi:glycolate oxidase